MEERSRILVPIRYAAWLSGDLGRRLERDLRHGLGAVPGADVLRIAGGFLVEADEDPGPFVAAVFRAVTEMDDGIARTYPVFHHELGSLWEGTLQVVFPVEPRLRAS